MKNILVAPLLMALSMGVQAADTFRCKNDLVQVGDPKVSVMVKCGEPMTKDSSCQVLGGAPGTVVYDSSGKPIGNVINIDKTIRDAVRGIGYVNDDDVFHADKIFINNYLTTQSPDISQGVNVSRRRNA